MIHRQHLLAIAIATCAGHAVALPFSPIDARSLSMGGVGVANARAASAGLFNPALLSTQDKEADFSIILPSVGVILDDQDNLVETLEDVQDGSLARVEDDIDRINQSGSAGTANPGDVQALGASAQALAGDLPRLGNKPVAADVGAGLGFGVPGKKVGVGLYVANNIAAGVVATIDSYDVGLLDRLGIYAQDGVFDAGEQADTELFDSSSGSTQLRDVSDLLQSSITVVGVSIGEAGIPLSREFTIAGRAVALGFTPKMLMVDTIHYRQVVSSDEELGDIIDDSRYRREYSDFNFDLGAASVTGEEGRELSLGVVIRNLITQSYQTAPDQGGRTYDINIEPQVRVGVAKRWNRCSAAADLDITKNQSVGLGKDSQFLGVGTEYDLRYLQLRAGYRFNLVSDGVQDMATAGIGLGPLDVTALYADEHSLGVNVQLGFSF